MLVGEVDFVFQGCGVGGGVVSFGFVGRGFFLDFFFLERAIISVMSTSSAGATCGDMLREIHFSRPLFLLSIDDDKGISLLPFDRDEDKGLSVAKMPRKESTRLVTSCEGSD